MIAISSVASASFDLVRAATSSGIVGIAVLERVRIAISGTNVSVEVLYVAK